jgi:hypothetical protein
LQVTARAAQDLRDFGPTMPEIDAHLARLDAADFAATSNSGAQSAMACAAESRNPASLESVPRSCAAALRLGRRRSTPADTSPTRCSSSTTTSRPTTSPAALWHRLVARLGRRDDVCLLGVRAVLAASFERIPPNLVGMGILPLHMRNL